MINFRAASILFFSFLVFFSICFGQTNWTKYVNNPVMVKDTTIQGIWEWAGIGQPFCLLENDTFKMWYVAAGVAFIGDSIVRGRISYAHSVDGTTWVKPNPPTPVLDVGQPGEWDSRWLDTPAVLNDGTEYKLYYYGDSLSAALSALGAATSPDGINWTRHSNNPILQRGELLDWDGFWLESPAVLYDSSTGVYSMWYTGVGYGPGFPSDLWVQIGYAYSSDGLTWIKDTLNNPVLTTDSLGSWDDGWVSVPAVRKNGGIYEMWYVGASSSDWLADSTLDTSRVGYATSPDGITWTKYPGNPILTNFDPPVDTGGPWAPDVLFDGTEYKMWYETVRGMAYATAPQSAIEEQDKSIYSSETIRVYPNPFSECVEIHLVGVTDYQDIGVQEIKIYDLSGREVRSFSISNFQFPISVAWDGRNESGKLLPSGVYFAVFSSGRDIRRSTIYIIR